jgi:MFS family permease
LNRSFYALLISQTSTNLGFALYTMVVVMNLYNETGSTTLSATVTLISVISRMVSGMVLPIISDRFKLPYLLMFSQMAQLFFLSGLFILFLQELSTEILILIFVLLSLISFFNGFFSPVKSSIVRAIVPEHKRVKANSLISSVDQTFLFAGWTFGGLLLSLLGKEITLVITFSLTLLSILSMLIVKVNNAPRINSQEGLISRLTTGWKFLFQHRGLRVLIIMDLLESWVGTIWIGAITLTYAEEALGKSEAWWGYINGGYYLGSILGTLLVFRISNLIHGRLISFMLSGSVVFGLLTFIYGFISNPYLALFLVLLMGPSYQVRDLAQETMFQNSTDESTMTKILAAKSTLVQFIFILSIVGIGTLTDLIGVRLIYILSGSVLMISSLFGFVQLIVRQNGNSLEQEHTEILQS